MLQVRVCEVWTVLRWCEGISVSWLYEQCWSKFSDGLKGVRRIRLKVPFRLRILTNRTHFT